MALFISVIMQTALRLLIFATKRITSASYYSVVLQLYARLEPVPLVTVLNQESVRNLKQVQQPHKNEYDQYVCLARISGVVDYLYPARQDPLGSAAKLSSAESYNYSLSG